MSTLTFNRTMDLHNMVLGALIALSSEQYVGKLAKKAASENVFLGKWLKRVKKERRYPKCLSDDIDKFLHIYTIEGRTGNLAALFWQIFSEFKVIKAMPEKFSQPDALRFDNAMKTLAKNDWFISLPIDHCKDTEPPYRPSRKKEIFTTKWYMNGAFNEQKKLAKTFSIFIVSPPQEVIDCLYEYGFLSVIGIISHDDDGNDYYQCRIFPNNDCYGNVVIPSKFHNFYEI